MKPMKINLNLLKQTIQRRFPVLKERRSLLNHQLIRIAKIMTVLSLMKRFKIKKNFFGVLKILLISIMP